MLDNVQQEQPFEPPAPMPRTTIPSFWDVIHATLKNPISVWGQPSYQEPWIKSKFLNENFLILNDPDLIHHVLVSNVKNYRMGTVRQLLLRPILRDGLLTAEGNVWKRSRKSVAPVFAPRHAKGFATLVHKRALQFTGRYEAALASDQKVEISNDMTALTYEILSETLFSGEISSDGVDFSEDVDRLLHTMGRVDPLDLIKAPSWVPRLQRLRGRKVLAKFRQVVSDATTKRRQLLDQSKIKDIEVPRDFLTLLLKQEGPDGLSRQEIEDNLITFIGAGHETTARALAWTIYCVANTPKYRAHMEHEADDMHQNNVDPVDWLDQMPWTRAIFEETLRLYPPAPTISRAALSDDEWTSPSGKVVTIEKNMTVLIMPWVLHRHEKLWKNPRIFYPERFLPENRSIIDKFQYLPFGAGPRICIGATFAMQEAVIALGVLMYKYRFHCTDETNPWPVQKLTVQPENGMPMRVERRN